MTKSWILAAAAMALLAPAGAHAAVTFDTATYNTSKSTCYNGATGLAYTCTGSFTGSTASGTSGNYLMVTGAEDATLSVKITAWQGNQSTGAITAAYLGTYGGGGLGVTQPDADYGGNYGLHQIDNTLGYTEFVMLQFSRAVHLDSAGMKIYAFGDLTSADSDMSISMGSLAAGKTGPALALTTTGSNAWKGSTNLTSTNLNSLSWTGYDRDTKPAPANGFSDSQTLTSTTKNPVTNFSQIWLVSASNVSSDLNDGFKLSQLIVTPKVAVTPEPGTWAMMIFGFGGIGVALRRRARQVATAAAA